MSQFITQCLVIDANKKPDFQAARDYVETMSHEELLSAFINAGFFKDDIDELDSPSDRLIDAILNVEETYMDLDQFPCRGAMVYVYVTDCTNTDEYYLDYQLFMESRVYEVAGFE